MMKNQGKLMEFHRTEITTALEEFQRRDREEYFQIRHKRHLSDSQITIQAIIKSLHNIHLARMLTNLTNHLQQM